jgi:hypothetical protein
MECINSNCSGLFTLIAYVGFLAVSGLIYELLRK